VHEIKHDGFGILARRDERGVRLFTRNGYNFTDRFPLIADAINSLPVQSCLIDGEAIVVGTKGLSVFDLIRYRQHDRTAILCAFDLIELDGKDLHRKALEERKHTLANVLYRKRDGIVFNRHYDGDVRSSSNRPARSAAKACLKAPRLIVPLRPHGPLAQDQEPGGPRP
jgi:ATP-dependent DNA ligase